MKKTRFICRSHLFTLLLIFVATSLSAQTKEGSVLIINTHRETVPMSDCIIKSVIRGLPDSYKSTSVFTDNMHTLQVNDEAQLEELCKRLFTGYDEMPPHVIVLQSNGGWVLLHEEIERLWGDVPIILCANEDFVGPREAYLQKRFIEPQERTPLEEALRGKNVTVIPFKRYLPETIELMITMQPDMDELIFISDQRQINAQIRNDLQHIYMQKYPSVKLTLLTEGEISTQVMLDSISKAKPRTGILFSSWYKHFANGHRNNSWGYRLVSKDNKRPIFMLSDITVGEGKMIGGYFQLFEEFGQAVSRATTEILEGKQARDIPTVYVQPRNVLNYETCKRFGVSIDNVPAGCYFYAKPDTLWVRFQEEIVGGGVIVMLLLIIVSTLLYLSRRMRHVQEKEMELMQKYNGIFNGMPIAYLRCKILRDADGEINGYFIQEANPAFGKIFYPEESIKGKKGGAAVWESGGARYNHFIKRLRTIDISKDQLSFPYTHQETGNTYIIFFYLSPDHSEVNMFYVDTTELLQAQQLLRTTNHKMELALESASIIPWKWDVQTGMLQYDIDFSDRAKGIVREEKYLTISMEQLFAQVHEDDRERIRSQAEALVQRKIPKLDEQYRALNVETGEYDWIEARAIVDQCDAVGAPISIVGSSVNINERKQLEEVLIEAKEEAEKSSQLKTAFLANMSHEIRTPLNSIVGFSGILATTESEEEKKEYVEIIERNNELLLQLINDILDLSRIESGMMEFTYTEVDLNEIMVGLEYSARLKARPNLVVEFEKHQPECLISTERIRVTQVMTNFISNALKFTDEGSIRFGYELTDSSTFLRLYVTDTGSGIPEESVNQVFGRFVKLNNFIQGSGLGLSICETIARNMGGSIGVESKPGVGSTFWIKIPYHPVQVT